MLNIVINITLPVIDMWFDMEFDRMFRRLSDRFFDMDDSFEGSWPNIQTFGPYYGYKLTVGPDGKPIVYEYGNVKPQLGQLGDVCEPFVDDIVEKDNKTLKLVAEIPGVEKKDIKVTIQGGFAHLAAEHGDRKYSTKVPLKYKVDENSAKATYVNGILEVTFALKENEPKGKTVNIE